MTLKFRFFSDVHLEKDTLSVKRPTVADLWSPIALDDDPQTVLILAGDIWNGLRPLSFAGCSWLEPLSKRFKAVVAILGNHDYWDANVDTLSGKWRGAIAEAALSNVHLLEVSDGAQHGSVVIDGVRIIGGTMWTDMNRGDPTVVTKYDFELGFDGRPAWNDQNFIRSAGYSRFTAKHWLAQHRLSIHNLRHALQQGDEDILLVTHHAPCMVSAPPRDGDRLSSYLYGSDLSELILDHPRIKQVIHGHTHQVFDYLMGDVRIRCNPRGYAPDALVAGFDPVGCGEHSAVI